MKYFIACILTLAALGSSPAKAQETVVATVPFDFVVGNRTFPAGKYTISSSSSEGFPGPLAIRSSDGKVAGFVLPTTGASNGPADASRLVFLHEGDKYYLNEVVGGVENYTLTGRH